MTELWAWLPLGFAVGALLALTGAGGAILGVPMVMLLYGYSAKEATSIGLVMVFTGAITTWIPQRINTRPRMALIIAASSFPGSLLATWIKAQSPVIVIELLFMSVCLFSLITLWRKPKTTQNKSKQQNPRLPALVASGGFLGILMTLTGLGGGVILVPGLKRFAGLSFAAAIATTLFTTSIGAGASLGIQAYTLGLDLPWAGLGLLALGQAMSGVVVRKWVVSISAETADRVRKALFSAVVVYALAQLGWEIVKAH